ncbi:hypothetical protein KBTX_03421 [wastewater metagenome]|uniref:Uncharacterized protein n=3 Tax=root TaxID=1 RepID=A0A5B8RET5_9ZZZZ|nr:hypothetical protein KBTEX_03421 [uncultured organism]
MRRDDAKTVYVDADSTEVRLDSGALRMDTPDSAPAYIPLSRVGRVVVRGSDRGLLEACLAIVARGGVVHFEGRDGGMRAIMQHANPAENRSARELAGIIEQHGGLGPFHWWQDAQRRHAWSVVFRRTLRGDFERGYDRLMTYLGVMVPGVPVEQERHRLDGKLHAWIQAELARQGLQPVVRALAEHGGDLLRTLHQCLSLTSCWAYVRWRREQPRHVTDRELTRFFELRTVAALPRQLDRHLRALAHEYHSSWNRIEGASGQE